MTRKNVLMVLTAFVLGVLIVASVSASGLVGATANGGGAPATNATGRTVSVGATGSASAQPDEAVVYVAVTATANDAATARDRVATNATSVRKALAALVGPDQVRTTSFNVYQRSDTTPTKTGTRTHYYATHAFAVTVSNVDSVGTVIDTAIDGGAVTSDGGGVADAAAPTSNDGGGAGPGVGSGAKGGCGCRVDPSGSEPSGALLALGALGLLARRRRSRRAS